MLNLHIPREPCTWTAGPTSTEQIDHSPSIVFSLKHEPAAENAYIFVFFLARCKPDIFSLVNGLAKCTLLLRTTHVLYTPTSEDNSY